jgi:hypothetical protein
MFDENIIGLTQVHPWMTFEEAWLLMRWSYEKNKSQLGYCGRNSLLTLMGIDYGIYQRQTEPWLRGLILQSKKKFNFDT